MTVFNTILGTSQTRFRIGLVGPTIYTGSADPTVSPPTPIADGLKDGDIYIRTMTGAAAIWVADNAGVWTQLASGAGGGSFSGDIVMNPGAQILGDDSATAGAPAYAFDSDDNTGMFQNNPDEISFATGGIGRFIIESDGTLASTTAGYETLVLADNDIPNRKFTQDTYLNVTGDSISGDLTFTGSAQAVLANGTVSDPALTFASDPNTGFFYPSLTGRIAVTSDGEQVMTFNNDGLLANGANQFIGSSGSVGVPSFTFNGDQDTGIFSDSLGEITFTSNGAETIAFNGTSANGTLLWQGGDGSAATPALSFNSDPNTGFHRIGSGDIGYSSDGTTVVTIDGTSLDTTIPFRAPDGIVATPAFSFTSDPDTGLINTGSGTIGIVSDGTTVVTIDGTELDTPLFIRGPNGLTATPTFSFSSATDTGMFLDTGNIKFAAGAADRVTIETDGTLSVNTASYESLLSSNNDIPNKLYVDNRANTGKTSIWVRASDMIPTTTSGCSSLTQVELVAGQPELEVLDFDSSSDESAQFCIALPNGWNKGTITWQAFWTTASGATDNVAWQIQGVSIGNDDPIAVAYGTATEVIDAALGTANDMHVAAESAVTTIAGTLADAEKTYFKITRNTSTPTNLAADARLLGVKIFYTRDQGNDS